MPYRECPSDRGKSTVEDDLLTVVIRLVTATLDWRTAMGDKSPKNKNKKKPSQKPLKGAARPNTAPTPGKSAR